MPTACANILSQYCSYARTRRAQYKMYMRTIKSDREIRRARAAHLRAWDYVAVA